MKIAGDEIEKEVRSREGTVYITRNYVYKLFGKGTNPYDVLGTYHEAERQGVPVTSTAKFTGMLQDGINVTQVSGIRSTRASGKFFQFSKGGGTAALVNAIMGATNRPLLRMILTGLENAAAAGLMDPQGFVSPNSNPPLTFIDVHMRGTPNPVAFMEPIQAARTRLAQLDD